MNENEVLIFNLVFRRILYTLPVLFGVTLITFCLFHWVGGDPVLHYAGKNADEATVQSLRTELGLDRSLVTQYANHLQQVAVGDWGRSWATSESIGSMISQRLKPTLLLTAPAFLISFAVALILALIAARFRRFTDSAVVVMSLSMMSVSFLVYIVLLQKWLAFDGQFFPVYGWDSSQTVHFLALPWLIYAVATVPPKILLFRSALLEEVTQDYVRTARAKGLGEFQILTRHVLRNSLIPIVTLSFAQMPALITGSLLLEAYFGIPGLGGLLATAIHGSDFPVIKAMTVLGSLAYIGFNLMGDLINMMLDPRLGAR